MLITDSERLFHNYCVHHRFTVEKVKTSVEKTPDFLLKKESMVLYAEVKEFVPNEDDKKYEESIERGEPGILTCEPGQRIREAIVNGAKQLKKFASECPSIVVIYENLGQEGFLRYSSSVHINVAMYGHWMVQSVRVPEAIRKPDFCGGDGTTTRDHKRYLSAVCVMTDDKLLFYHNSFADHPLPKDSFTGENCFHFRKNGDPHSSPGSWERF
jgi:hypothetical protein